MTIWTSSLGFRYEDEGWRANIIDHGISKCSWIRKRIRALCANPNSRTSVNGRCHIRLYGFNDSSVAKIEEKLLLVINMSNGMQLKTTSLVVPNFWNDATQKSGQRYPKTRRAERRASWPELHIPGPINMILGARLRASIIETQNFPCRGFRFFRLEGVLMKTFRSFPWTT